MPHQQILESTSTGSAKVAQNHISVWSTSFGRAQKAVRWVDPVARYFATYLDISAPLPVRKTPATVFEQTTLTKFYEVPTLPRKPRKFSAHTSPRTIAGGAVFAGTKSTSKYSECCDALIMSACAKKFWVNWQKFYFWCFQPVGLRTSQRFNLNISVLSGEQQTSQQEIQLWGKFFTWLHDFPMQLFATSDKHANKKFQCHPDIMPVSAQHWMQLCKNVWHWRDNCVGCEGN